MKNKLLKLNAVALLGLALSPLQGQTTMNVKAAGGMQTPYALSSIRKLTFTGDGNMTVTKTSGSTDNYVLTAVRNMNFSDVGTGIETNTAQQGTMKLYPNPVVDMLHIDISIADNQYATVELLGVDGKLLYKHTLTSATNTVDVSHYKQGMYLCRVNNGTTIATTKFFKQ